MGVSFKKYAAAGCLTLFLTLGVGSTIAQESSEYSVKATYLTHFIKFVEWPGAWDIASRSSVDVCVIGDSDILQGKSVFDTASTSKLSLSLVSEDNVPAIAGHCHIAYIGDVDAAKTKEVLAALHGKPVLTVSDKEGFAESGGMVGFVRIGDNVRFVMNPKLASVNNLKIDARLLEIAVKVIR